jgi:hypothetical protein
MAAALYERELELQALTAAVRKVREGGGQVVVVEGPGASGSRAWLRPPATWPRPRGCARSSRWEQSSRGRSRSDSSGSSSTQSWRRTWGWSFCTAARPAAPIFEPTSSPSEPSADTLFARLHGLSWLAANLAERERIALLVDDAQWADPASLRALAFLARRLEDQDVLLVTGLRPIDDALVAELTRLSCARRRSRPGPWSRG